MRLTDFQPKQKYIVISLVICAVVLFGFLIVYMGVGKATAESGPNLSIPTKIPSPPDSVVDVPVSFSDGGHKIASIVFSIDYDQQLLIFDPNIPNAITFNVPGDFVAFCLNDIPDQDGEIDCFIYDPGPPPLSAVPDGMIATIKLKTVNYPFNIEAKVNFSTSSPATSFGNTNGQSVPGTTTHGSILIQPAGVQTPTSTATFTPTPTGTVGPPSTPTATPTPTNTGPPPQIQKIFLPITIRSQDCFDAIVNGGMENNTGWYLVPTAYKAGYTTSLFHSGARSIRTGILNASSNVYSYSDFRQEISIPSDAKSATLKVWLYTQSTEVNFQSIAYHPGVNPGIDNPLAGDAQYILLRNISNSNFDTLFWKLENNKSWQYHEIDLTSFRGSSKYLQFGTYNDGSGGVTAMFVDDVELRICK